MTNKISQREMVTMMLADAYVSANELYVSYLKHQLDVLDKKSASRKSATDSDENKALYQRVLSVFSVGDKFTVTEIQTKDEVLGKLSNQKVSFLVRHLSEVGSLVKTVEKKKSYFSLPTDEVEIVEVVD